MRREQRQFKLNIPEDVKRWLADEASKNMRSQTAEIVLAIKEKMLRQSVEMKSGTEAAA